MRNLGWLAIALALSAATVPQAAPAAPARLLPQAGHRAAAAAVSVPIVHLTQPPGVGCVAVKINSGGSTAPWWGAINCNNGLAYSYKGTPAPIVLALPAGATSERAYNIDMNGYAIGVVYNGAGTATPMLWNPGGGPMPGAFGSCVAGVAPTGIAAGFHKTGWSGSPVVGQNLAGAPSQACWWWTAPAHLIPPVPASQSFAYDVNLKPIYVGQLNGAAAAGVGPGGPLAPIAGVSGQSVAYAINSSSLIVGHEDFSAAGCGTLPKGAGFFLPYGGPVTVVGPLAGDCTAGLEDLNDIRGAVGYSFQPGLQQAMGFQLSAPYPGGLFNLNTGVAPHPWALLSDAPGIDDAGDIIATDTGVAPSQVYVLI